jgi:hypothetical protein
MATYSTEKTAQPNTLCEVLEKALAGAGRHSPGAEEKPAAILWTDADGQWAPVVAKLQERMPHLLVLGDYAPQEKRGPAIWIKCVIARTIDAGIPENVIPIIYLPKVSRQVLRAAADCPPLLQPIVELQFRGVVWTQRNGKDWTVEAFLMSDDALGLSVAKDDATRRSIHAALPVLADAPLGGLRNKHLEAEDFDKLVVGDHPRDLLDWMTDPEGTRKRWSEGKWHAFRSRCQKDYEFDPEAEGALGAAERLGLRRGDRWRGLWDRFCESPASYQSVPKLLTAAKPQGELLFDGETWPDENERLEFRLREGLLALDGIEATKARNAIQLLETEHGVRRSWVWASLGQSPLAVALKHLAKLAERTEKALNGATAEEMAIRYEEGGYEADAALLEALSIPKTAVDKAAVQAAARSLYLPWVRDAADALQKEIATHPLPSAGDQTEIEAKDGECLLFADGLRFDLGQQLRALCEERGLRVASRRRWAALPTVTATAKPAVSPIASGVSGGISMPEDFAPSFDGQPLNTARFRSGLKSVDCDFLPAGETGDPSGKAWTECGSIDSRGHDLQLFLAGHVNDELERLVERVVELLDAGWRSVRVVTDHGWLLTPGGLPKTELPGFLVASRWSRCAAIKGNSKVTVPKVGWHWNPSAEVAVAPNVSAFVAGQEYAHGGVSLQECIIPDLTIEPPAQQQAAVRIQAVEWQRLRCRVQIDPPLAGITIDVRTKANLADSSLAAAAKPTDESGLAALMIPNEDNAGMAAVVVAMDPTGKLLSKETTTIGGD